MEQLLGVAKRQPLHGALVIGLRNQRGSLLLEMLAGIVITGVVAAGAISFVRAQSVASRTQLAQTDANDEVRGVIEYMAREIRLAGYYPRCTAGAQWAAINATHGIIAAGPQTLHIQYDLNENGTIDAPAANSEDVTYQYDTVNHKVQRVVGGVTSDLATDVPSANFGFKYYNCSPGSEVVGAGAGGALTAAQMATVCRIAIRFEAALETDVRTAQHARSSLSTNVLLRNRQNVCA
jgi:type II secretory pathway component PulJ